MVSCPFIAVGGGSSGEGLTGSPSGADDGGAVVYGSIIGINFDYE